MNAHLTLALNFFCLLALLHGAKSQKKTKPTRLTGQSTDEYVIPFALLDQCFPYEESKTFGLEFRLPEMGGRCDKGMLICYPSTLITHPLDNDHTVNGMSVNSELFNVGSAAAKNSLAKECKELLARISVKKYKDREFWHGIQVYTVKKSDGTIAMKLNTSLSDGHSFEIPQAQRQFIIHLGNEREFVTYVRIDKGEPVEVEGEKAKWEAYKQLAPRGARLKDFVGLWTLGLDMLPWMNDTMRLHVQRDCDCFMEAWFIRPTDSEPADIKELTRGSAETECSKEEKTNLTVSLKNNPLKADHLIHIRLMASKFTRNVTFKLYTSGWKAHIALMSFVISCKRGFVFMRSARERHVNGGYFRDALDCGRNQSTHQLEFRIALTKYSYGIMFGRFVNNEYRLTRLSEEEFFPPKWWQGLPFENMDYYRLSGEFMLLNDPPPPVMPFKKIGENYRPKMQTDHFNTFPVDNLIEGTLLTFRVKPHNPKDYTFNIMLLHDRPEEHPTIGKTVLKIQVYPNKLRLSPNFVEDKEINDRFKDVPHDIERDLLEVNITVFSDRFYIFTINGELVNNAELNSPYPVLPIWATNNVRIDGNISQLGPPRINMPPFRQSTVGNNRKAFTKFTKKLRTLLNYNDTITIDMEIYNTSKFFTIYLMDESLEPDPSRIGHLVLMLPFTVNDSTLTQCRYYLHQDEPKLNGTVVDNRLNVNGQRFNMTIKCAEGHFVINLNEVDFYALECSYPTTKDNITMPPWSVDHIQIRGDLFVHTLEVTHPEESTPEFFMGVDHNEAVLKPGDVINVKININKTLNEKRDFNVTVNLFYDALQFNEKVGKTVMSIKFYKKQNGLLYFDSYDNGTKGGKTCYNNTLNLTLASQELDFKIEAIYNETTKTEGFNVTLNDVYMCAYMDGLPPWAVHYITIEPTNVKLGSATKITCKPKKRCRPRNRTDIYVQDGKFVKKDGSI